MNKYGGLSTLSVFFTIIGTLFLAGGFILDAVGRCVGIRCDAISGRMKLSLQAARSTC